MIFRMVRKAWLASRVAGAWVSGAAWRYVRRAARRGPRIRHGTFPMHMTRGMVDVDRIAGFESASIVHHVELNPRYSLVGESDFDIVLAKSRPWNEWHWATLEHLLVHSDIFVMYCDTRFAPQNRPGRTRAALRLLRWAGVKIVAVTSGLDVVHDNGVTTRFDFLAQLSNDNPQWDLRQTTPMTRAGLRVVADCAHFIVSGDAACSRFMPREDARFKYFPVTVLPLAGEQPSGGPVRIVHAPNHRHIKGTNALVTAVAALQRAGLACELQLVEGTPPVEARAIYANADIVADQFCIGSFGLFALEGMLLGKPVLAYLDEEHLGDPAFNLPIVNANPDNLARVLAPLVALPELRRRIGAAGCEAVKRFQAPEALAPVWSAIYRHLWTGAALDLERLAYFDRPVRTFTEDPGDSRFWPVPVQGLMPAIREAVDRA